MVMLVYLYISIAGMPALFSGKHSPMCAVISQCIGGHRELGSVDEETSPSDVSRYLPSNKPYWIPAVIGRGVISQIPHNLRTSSATASWANMPYLFSLAVGGINAKPRSAQRTPRVHRPNAPLAYDLRALMQLL